MIRMKSGVYGGRNGMKRPGDGTFSLSSTEEARLVNRGVAAYVTEGVSLPEENAVVNPYESMTMAELRVLCKERGVPMKIGQTKAEMAAALLAADDQKSADDTEDVFIDPVDADSEPSPIFDASEAVE